MMMSAFGGKAGHDDGGVKCPLMTQSGHLGTSGLVVCIGTMPRPELRCPR